MTRRAQFARCFAALPVRASVVLFLALSLAGCHHKTLRQSFPLATLAPVPLESDSLPDSLAEIATLPEPELEPPSSPPPPKPAPRPRPTPKEEPKSPQQVASAPEPAALAAIGTLSTGGDAAPQSQQEARDLIASILKRIAALPAKTADEKKQLRQVTNFIDQAKKALNSGDADGAKNLATKAKLLMDDLEKK